MTARTLCEKQISVKIATPLYDELKKEAAAHHRSVSNLVRRALINHVLARKFGKPAGEHSQGAEV